MGLSLPYKEFFYGSKEKPKRFIFQGTPEITHLDFLWKHSTENLKYLLDYCDLILIMLVNPGFGGQKTIMSQVKKLLSVSIFFNTCKQVFTCKKVLHV